MVSVTVGGGGGGGGGVSSCSFLSLCFFGFSVDVVSVVFVVSVSAVSVEGALSVVSVGGGRRVAGRGCVVITIGAGRGGICAGICMPLDIAPGCCGGITPV